ncbi:MAG: hypothetical protein PHF50_04170 [Patescibacteria group bacterium]|nr:hypothetical protein [Patescibacteria group bacterium]
MAQQTVGFFTEESAQSWFFEHGDQVEVIAQKRMEPKGDGSPHLIVKMILPDKLKQTLYPDGKIQNKSFEEYDGRLL